MRPWMKFILGAIAFVIIANAVSRQMGSSANRDFEAYYRAGARVLAGQNPYVVEYDFPYKYGPATIAPFLFFQLFSYDVARWVYCILQTLVVLGIPLINLVLLARARLETLNARTYFWGLIIGFAGSLRFLDGEFRTNQISTSIYLSTIVAILLLSSSKQWRNYLGVGVLAMVSQMKIHSTVMWYALTKRLFSKRNLLLLVPAVILYLLPSPVWWLEWARQIKETTPLLPGTVHSFNRQGFFGVAVIMLRWQEYGVGPWLLSLPFAVYAAIRLPKFSLSEIKNVSHENMLIALALTLLAWMLWGFMASPLPWAHTYSLLWGILPLMWCAGTRQERQWIFCSVLGLAISPKAIIGEHMAHVFEGYQGPFFLILTLWLVLVSQARRHALAKTLKSI